ncbi:hypothetical protein [Terricaulis sp.]|uniref:hypothetical protein n=1 Tax=Terricaulis sp. TaxID=2768686 RepID=UPI003784B324
MRKLLAVFVCAAALAVPAAAPAQTRQGWSYAYVDGVATATQAGERGRPAVTLTCRPPDGDILITDYTLARAARRAQRADVRVGNLSVNIPMALEGRGRNQTVVIHLPQRPPMLAGVQPTDQLSVTVNGQTRTYGGESGMMLKDVAYACWGS